MMKTQLEIRMELKSSCVLASYGNAERKKKKVKHYTSCNFGPFQELADLCEE